METAPSACPEGDGRRQGRRRPSSRTGRAPVEDPGGFPATDPAGDGPVGREVCPIGQPARGLKESGLSGSRRVLVAQEPPCSRHPTAARTRVTNSVNPGGRSVRGTTSGRVIDAVDGLSLIHISEPTRRTPISYAVFCLKQQ